MANHSDTINITVQAGGYLSVCADDLNCGGSLHCCIFNEENEPNYNYYATWYSSSDDDIYVCNYT